MTLFYAGFGGNPGEIIPTSRRDGNGYNLGDFVKMAFLDGLLHLSIERPPALDYAQVFLALLNPALPPVTAFHRNNLHACGKSLLQ